MVLAGMPARTAARDNRSVLDFDGLGVLVDLPTVKGFPIEEGHPGVLAEILKANVLPSNLERIGSVADTMNLEGDETGGRHVILEVGGGDAIDPGLDRIADGDDSVVVPIVLLERLSGGFVVFEVVEPPASGLVVDARRPGASRGIDLHLVTMDTVVFVIGFALAANLNSRVQFWVDLEIEF